MKKTLSHIFVDGVNGMAFGIFCTYALGTILQQIGNILAKDIGDILISLGGLMIMLMGAGIALGMASKFQVPPTVALPAMLAGMIGAHSDAIFSSSILTEKGVLKIADAGDPFGAFVAALIALEVGRLISGKTELDILLTPLATTALGCTSAMMLAPVLDTASSYLVKSLEWSSKQGNDLVMGILISCLACIFSILPVSLFALLSIAKLNGLAAGAATIGCCCSMIGFAVAGYRDNKICGLFLQGIGTGKLQLANCIHRPYLIFPPLISSAILGGVAAGIFQFTNTAKGASLGTTGLAGCISAYNAMVSDIGSTEALLVVSLLCFVMPGVISLGVAEGMRKFNLLKDGHLKINI